LESPLISIIIPTYNAVKYVQDTINSCLNQTYNNIEVIIQDDCSTDGTWELINTLYNFNPKVKLHRNLKNLGIGENWNAAFEKAKGEFLIIFNADDLMEPDLISAFLVVFNSDPTIDIITGKFEILFSNTGKTILYPDHVNLEGGVVKDLFEKLYFKSSFHWNFSLVKMELIKKVKLSNGNLFLDIQICDYELWYRCFLANAKVYFDTTKTWGYYRKHESNNSSNPNGELKSFLRVFLSHHHISYRKLGGISYPKTLLRNFITFCNLYKRGSSFEIKVFFLYLKRIVQGIA